MSKSYHTQDNEDQALKYKLWHRTRLSGKCYAFDVDLIEWRANKNGQLIPVAITELTRVKPNKGFSEVTPNLLKYIELRFFQRSSSADTVQYIAEKLNIPVYLVVVPDALDYFWVFAFKDRSWTKYSENEYVRFLEAM